MAKPKLGLPTGIVIKLVLLVVVGLFLFGKFFEKVGEEWQFVLPASGTEGVALTVIQLLLVFAMTWAAFALAPTLGMEMGKKRAFSLILVAILAFFAYKYVMEPIFTATSLSEIGTNIGLKLGLL